MDPLHLAVNRSDALVAAQTVHFSGTDLRMDRG